MLNAGLVFETSNTHQTLPIVFFRNPIAFACFYQIRPGHYVLMQPWLCEHLCFGIITNTLRASCTAYLRTKWNKGCQQRMSDYMRCDALVTNKKYTTKINAHGRIYLDEVRRAIPCNICAQQRSHVNFTSNIVYVSTALTSHAGMQTRNQETTQREEG